MLFYLIALPLVSSCYVITLLQTSYIPWYQQCLLQMLTTYRTYPRCHKGYKSRLFIFKNNEIGVGQIWAEHVIGLQGLGAIDLYHYSANIY